MDEILHPNIANLGYAIADQARTLAEKGFKQNLSDETILPHQIRVSVGSGIILGLLGGKLDAEPTTAYLMTYKKGKCTANCGFCPQARSSQSNAELLSRVKWPVFETTEVLSKVKQAVSNEKIRRVCIQALNYPRAFSDVSAFVEKLKGEANVQVSVSCQPFNSRNLRLLHEAGVNRVGIALDAATEKLFKNVKGAGVGGPYNWEDRFMLLREALEIFGERNVSTHLIVGLGETEIEAAGLIQKCTDLGVLVALFAFTPVEGTTLASNPPPKVHVYRRVQVANYLIAGGLARADNMSYDVHGRIVEFGVSKTSLIRIVKSGKPFLTSGCSDCNRPFYNEKPSGPIYNYPRSIRQNEIAQIRKELEI